MRAEGERGAVGQRHRQHVDRVGRRAGLGRLGDDPELRIEPGGLGVGANDDRVADQERHAHLSHAPDRARP